MDPIVVKVMSRGFEKFSNAGCRLWKVAYVGCAARKRY
jgi:hypothetical protein